MAEPAQRYFKALKESEIRHGRISIPAEVRDLLFPHLPQNTKISVTMVDETDVSYPIVIKVRKNRTKPEIMAKGGKNFVRKRNLKHDDLLQFSLNESPDRFRVRVIKSRHPPASPATEADAPVELQPATGAVLSLSIGFAHATTTPTPVLGVGSSLGSDNSWFDAHGDGKMPMAIASMGNALYGVKAEEKEDEPNLELNLGSLPAKRDMKLISSLPSGKLAQVGFKEADQKELFLGPQVMYAEESHELQEPKTPTALVLAPPAAELNFSRLLSDDPSLLVNPKTELRGSVIPFEILTRSGKPPGKTNKVVNVKRFKMFIP